MRRESGMGNVSACYEKTDEIPFPILWSLLYWREEKDIEKTKSGKGVEERQGGG